MTAQAADSGDAGAARRARRSGTTGHEAAALPRLLIVDHHDSYTYNLLISLLDAIVPEDATEEQRKAYSKQLLSRCLIIPSTDALWQNVESIKADLLPHFDAVILSPGPGRPDVKADFGASKAFLQTMLDGGDDSATRVPTLGICLGHQGIAEACGARIKRARHLRHGLSSKLCVENVSEVTRWPGILQDLKQGTLMTTYNSLVVDESTLPPQLVVTAFANDGSIHEQDTASDQERVAMALQHRSLPVWGVQFHPESIASESGHLILRNFLHNVGFYWKQMASQDRECRHSSEVPQWLRSRYQSFTVDHPLALTLNAEERKDTGASYVLEKKLVGVYDVKLAPAVFGRLMRSNSSRSSEASAVWLDSARPGGTHGRFSFMALPSWNLRYDQSQSCVNVESGGKQARIELDTENQRRTTSFKTIHGLLTPKSSRRTSPEMSAKDSQVHDETDGEDSGFWNWFDGIQKALQRRCEPTGSSDIPFLTGFVGYFGYEMHSESLPASHSSKENKHGRSSAFPSAWFGFCDTILAIDHQTNEWFALGLLHRKTHDMRGRSDRLECVESALSKVDAEIGCTADQFAQWVKLSQDCLEKVAKEPLLSTQGDGLEFPRLVPVDSASEYKAKIEGARELIAAGESYELCLTTEFRGHLQEPQDSTRRDRHFDMYVDLRRRNPAPFSSFIGLNANQSILCTSPEKFFGMDAMGNVEMKPIKGTLARAGYAKGEEEIGQRMRDGDQNVVRWCAEQDEVRKEKLKGDAKERAENLMIVDLIRRDLLSFCAPESVVVPTLMGIESYATVHQMVTTVRGQKVNEDVGTVAALSRCFPPGSMTGAPKVRSVSLLAGLESSASQSSASEKRLQRGIYSGTLGWIGIDGAANFNVVIRTVCVDGLDVSVGAGGAITYPSNADGEWQEVLDKVGAIAKVDLS